MESGWKEFSLSTHRGSQKVEILKHGIVRRAKLYYLRGLTGKAATKIKEKKKVAKVIETITEKVTEPVVQTAAVQESIES